MKNTITLNANNALALDCLDAVYDGTNTLYLAFITSESFDVMVGMQKLGTITPANNTLLIDSSKYLEADLVLTINGSTITIKAPETAVGNMTVTAEDEATYQVKFYTPSSGGSDVSITPTLFEGTKIADFAIDGIPGELYAPEGGGSNIYVGSTPPAAASQGDLFFRKGDPVPDNVITQSSFDALVSEGHPIALTSFTKPSEGVYDFVISGIPSGDGTGETAWFPIQELNEGEPYRLEFDMQFTQAEGGWFSQDDLFDRMEIGTSEVVFASDLNSHHYTLDFVYSTGMQMRFKFFKIRDDYRFTAAFTNLNIVSVEDFGDYPEKLYVGGQWVDIKQVRSIEPIQTTGTKIAEVHNDDGTTTNLFAPAGGGGGVTTELLYSGNSLAQSIQLSKPWTDYDALYIIGEDDSLGSAFVFASTYFTADLATDYRVGVATDIGYIWYALTNSTTLSLVGAYTNYYIKAIRGIKFS